MTAIAERIKHFNAARNPELVPLKYKNMRASAFVFYRGSCHLFYEDLPAHSFFGLAPASWLCGDLHLQNFGCYKADNRAIYFDINDFDEAALAPCLLDVARVLTSILLAAPDTLNIDKSAAEHLCQRFVSVYAHTLAQGTARLMEEKLAQGALKTFLKAIQTRKRKAFIHSRTEKTPHGRKLLINQKQLNISHIEKQQLSDTLEAWAQQQENPEFFRVLDAGYRIAGTGSLGLTRYELLLHGHGKGERYLLDMKLANPSCLTPYLKLSQPVYHNEAERIIAVQKRLQMFPNALLNLLQFNDAWFVLKELQPSQDKIDLAVCNGDVNKIAAVIDTFAAIVAWDQLRSSGRQGSAIADELIAFADASAHWRDDLIAYSVQYAKQVQCDYLAYCTAYDAGYFS